MKLLFSIVIGILLLWLVFFRIDPAIVNLFLKLIPASMNDALPLLKALCWIILVLITGSFTIWLSFVISSLLYVALTCWGK